MHGPDNEGVPLKILSLILILIIIISQPLALSVHSASPRAIMTEKPAVKHRSIAYKSEQSSQLVRFLFNKTALFVTGGVLLHQQGESLDMLIAVYNEESQDYTSTFYLFDSNGSILSQYYLSPSGVYPLYTSPTSLEFADNYNGYAMETVSVNAETYEWSSKQYASSYVYLGEFYQASSIPNPAYVFLSAYYSSPHSSFKLYLFKNGGIQVLASFSYQYLEREVNILRPMGYENETLMIAGAEADGNGNLLNKIAVLTMYPNGTINNVVIETSTPSEADKATTAYDFDNIGVRYARIRMPWYAGYGGGDKLYVYRLGWSSGRAYDISSLGFYDISCVDIVRINGSYRVLLIGNTYDNGVYMPQTVLVDPETGGLIARHVYMGYSAYRVRAILGYYGGIHVAYLAIPDKILVVRLGDLSVIGEIETRVDSPVSVWFSSVSPYSVLAVAGYTGGNPLTEFYRVNSEGIPVRISLNAPSLVHANEPFNATIILEDYRGNPVSNATVVLAEMIEGGLVNLTALTTDADGSATGRIVLTERGVHRLIAYYPGEGLLYSAFSDPLTVTVVQEAVGSLSLETGVVAEGIPVSLTTSLLDAYTGSPISDAWVKVEANTSSGWASVGAGLTNSNGQAIITISLPTGYYVLRLTIVTPYIELVEPVNTTLQVLPPGTPLPEGPYVSPIGRVLSFPPLLAEEGEEASVYFAFYYGEKLAEPTWINVTVSPSTDFSVEEVSPGLYRVSLTPGETGYYTIVFTAAYNYATYVGVATFYVYNIGGTLGSINSTMQELIQSMIEANHTIYTLLAELGDMNSSIAGFLDNLNSTLMNTLVSFNNQLNYTLITFIGDLNNTAALYLKGINDSINHYLGDILEALRSANMTAYYAMLQQVNDTQYMILADIGRMNESLMNKIIDLAQVSNATYGIVVQDWSMIRGLNTTIYSFAEKFNASLENIRVLVAGNGELIVSMNTSTASLLQAVNASLTGLVKTSSGSIYALIDARTGIILANLSSISYNLGLINDSAITLETELGSLNMTIEDALHRIGLIEGMVVNINQTAAMILDNTGETLSILLNDLEPSLQAVRGVLALVNTRIGYIVANLSRIGYNITIIKSNITEIMNILETISENQGELPGQILSMINPLLDDIELKIDTRLGSLNVSLHDALFKLNLIHGILIGINNTSAKILDANGKIRSVLINDLKPITMEIKDNITLVRTRLGLLVSIDSKLNDILSNIPVINGSLEAIIDKLSSMDETLTSLNHSIQIQQGKLSTEASKASDKADRAYMVSVAASGLGVTGIATAIFSLVRRH